ncbi:MAG: dTDP-4-dehydrorhamnose reductase [Planctomycetota bacterium]
MPNPEHNLLILGAGGMLATAFAQLLVERGITHRLAGQADFDLTDPAAVNQAVTNNYTAVINCAAYTAVDAAEEHEDLATAVNGHAVATLAHACQQADALLVNYSTDYVFDGNATSPYTTDQPRDPLNAYGRSKAVGEAALEASNARWLNIRTSWLYAPWGNNFVLTMARLTRDKAALQVVDDQRGRPTSAQHLATSTLAMIEADATGHHHITDGGECTWFEFTQAIADILGHTCDIQPCNSDQYPRPAKRPAYSVLDGSKTEDLIGPAPHWKDNLASVLNNVKAETTPAA